MTLISSRATLTHRMTVQRDANIGTTDTWGNPLPPDWQDHLVDIQCKAWTVTGQGPRLTSTTETTAQTVVEGRRAIVPTGTDVTESDRVTVITRRGDTYLDGPMVIEAVLAYEDHLELVLLHALRVVL